MRPATGGHTHDIIGVSEVTLLLRGLVEIQTEIERLRWKQSG